MKVYILLECEQYEPDRILGVYATIELAQKASWEHECYLNGMEIVNKYLRITLKEVITE